MYSPIPKPARPSSSSRLFAPLLDPHPDDLRPGDRLPFRPLRLASAWGLGFACLLGPVACGSPGEAPAVHAETSPGGRTPGGRTPGGRTHPNAEVGVNEPDSLAEEIDGPGIDAPGIGVPGIDRRAYAELEGEIAIDGSSTVFPITEAMSLAFAELAPNAPVRLGVSGTGGGFEKFCRGETDLSNASRPIKEAERQQCRSRGIELVELPVAFDGISLVVHGENDFCTCLTLDELRRLWRPEARGRVENWSDLRSKWPDRKIHLFAPGRDSGTFDYFTSAVVGTESSSRSDFVGSEDDYLLAQDISAEPDALGFFGFAYYREYRDQLHLLAVDPGSGCVRPSEETIAEGTYRPLARPIFVYARLASLDRPEVVRFLELYLARAAEVVPKVGYVALPDRAYELARQRLDARIVGSLFDDGSEVGLSIEGLLEMEAASDVAHHPREAEVEAGSAAEVPTETRSTSTQRGGSR